ncbi:MAG: ribosome assembly RNA-binding protein YhbY [Bacilli bacterium]|nr:ribosome assembly RNA-binding protein YhbY [Bacilli bacterium]
MITNKQKVFLRGKANSLTSFFQIGKDGVSKNLLIAINNALEANELIKISVLKTAPQNTREISLDVCSYTKADIVQIIGHTIIIYRASKNKIYDLPKD